MRTFSIIVAVDEAMGIGKDGALPWRLPGDMRRLREMTVGDGGNAVIMGRKTWESIPARFQPLPDRLNVVVSRRGVADLPAGVHQATGFDVGLQWIAEQNGDDVVVLGGRSVYGEALQHHGCARAYVTEVVGTYDCDVTLSPLPKRFARGEPGLVQSENGIEYRFVVYENSSLA